MLVQNNQSKQSFNRLIVTDGALRLLKKADRLLKAENMYYLEKDYSKIPPEQFIAKVKTRKVIFIPDKENTNIPKGHKKPLWSVLSDIIAKRQEDNKNDIFIDVIKQKGRKLISVIARDKKGYKVDERIIDPKVRVGHYEDIYPREEFDYISYRNSLNPKVYGHSDLYDAVTDAEKVVNELKAQEKKQYLKNNKFYEPKSSDKKRFLTVKLKALKQDLKRKENILKEIQNTIIKKLRKKSQSDTKPFAKSEKPRLPRKLKKLIKKLEAKQKNTAETYA